MSLTLDTSVAGEYSNSYCDINYADDYWANHFSSVKSTQWAALSDDNKTTLLVQACRVIESLRFTYPSTLPEYAIHYDRRTGKILDMNLTRDPVKWFYYQNLQVPRNLDFDLNTGLQYIRDEFKMAQCEQAVYILNFDEGSVANRMQGITMEKISVGKGAVETTQEYAITGSMISPIAFEMVRRFMVKGGKLKRA